MTKQFEELIAKHLNGTLEENERQVLATLLNVPENQLYLASLIDEKFFDDGLVLRADDEIGESMFRIIQEQIHQAHNRVNDPENDRLITKTISLPWHKRRTFYWVAAASVILFVLVATWGRIKTYEQPITIQTKKPIDSASFIVRHEVNTTGNEKRIQLTDGSLIVLANNSEITFREPFPNNRDVSLNGKAYFKVVHDKTKPFIVTSGDISTMDLGTEFTVTAYKNTSYVIVRLYKGKVSVKAVDKANKKMHREVHLLPGQEFIYGNAASPRVRSFKVSNVAPEQAMKEERVYDNPLLPKDVDAPWFMFNNQSLKNVLPDLEAMYNVKIVYDEKDIQNIYFTSKYDKTVSLETILKQICTPNHLMVTKKDSAFYISR